MDQNTPPLIVIVGETASGKSALAMKLAERFNGEIICADSRTVYKGMDIGTAKPSQKDRQAVPHHLLDIAELNEDFNVRKFKQLANQAVADITSRGKLPIMAGGTGLYIDAVLFDYQFSPPGARRNLENPRHLKYQEHKAYQKGLRPHSLVIGLTTPKDSLEARIKQRINAMLKSGLEKEVKALVSKYSWDAAALKTIGYQEFQAYFAGRQTLAETTAQITRNTILYAKRQRTWFKRNPSIQWLEDPRESAVLVTAFLNKKP